MKPRPPTGPGCCRLCPRWEGVTHVCMPGFGPSQPALIAIGEGPASEEDLAGRPFVGAAGVLLRRALTDAGIDPNDVFYTNVVRCGSKAATPTMDQIRKCRSYLLNELEGIDYSRCKGAVLFGDSALKGATNTGTLSLKETRLRKLNGIGPPLPVPLWVTYHPAAALPHRAPALYDEIVGDLKDFMRERDQVLPLSSLQTIASTMNSAIGLDLEWRGNGQIRCVGFSSGLANAVIADAHEALEWLASVPKHAS